MRVPQQFTENPEKKKKEVVDCQLFHGVNSKMDTEWQNIRARELLRECEALQSIVKNPNTQQNAFYLVNLAIVKAKHQQWMDLLPRVKPFYAMKCNPDPRLLSTLAGLGAGFDCASTAEMENAIETGLGGRSPANEIIYANPCKEIEHIKGAGSMGVSLMTFDNASELVKVAKIYPSAEFILRILVDDSHSVCKMGNKYGAHMSTVPQLLSLAKSLKLNVRGVSYHVGSGCGSSEAFADAVKLARKTFDIGVEHGYEFDILDIGGGFPGQFRPSDDTAGVSFSQIASSLGPALDKYFPADSNVKIIGEPGRFYATSSHTLAANVIGRREPWDASLQVCEETLEVKSEPGPGYMYYINEGLYGSFNCVLYDHIELQKTNNPEPLEISNDDQKHDTYPCSLWGPTCDGLDCVMPNADLPLLEVGDWISFPDMGAYTHAAGSNFNGFEKPQVIYLD